MSQNILIEKNVFDRRPKAQDYDLIEIISPFLGAAVHMGIGSELKATVTEVLRMYADNVRTDCQHGVDIGCIDDKLARLELDTDQFNTRGLEVLAHANL